MDNSFTITPIDSKIVGPKIIKINQTYYDKRGSLWEIFRKDEIESALGVEFVCDKLSVSKAHVLRGLHVNNVASKLMNVLNGSSCHVIVDLRPGSITCRKAFSIVMRSGEVMLYVPPGFANGFYTLEDHTIVEYKLSEYYENYEEEVVSWNSVNICNWPSEIIWNRIISDKDNT